MLNNNITFTAKWLPKCEVRFETTQDIAPNPIITGKGKKISSDQFPVLSSNDFIFDGWYIGDTQISSNMYIDDDITLTAKWLKKCTVKFETMKGSAPESVIVGEGKAISSAQLPELIDSKDRFDGWYVGETKVVAGKYIIDKDVTLTAAWTVYLDNSHYVYYQSSTGTLVFDFSSYNYEISL